MLNAIDQKYMLGLLEIANLMLSLSSKAALGGITSTNFKLISTTVATLSSISRRRAKRSFARQTQRSARRRDTISASIEAINAPITK
jgi:hypothetical protein